MRPRDWMPAAVVAGVGLFELLVTPITEPGYRGPEAVAAIGILVSAGALLWRRSFPCSALAAIVAVLTVQWAYARGVAQLPNASFLAILIAGYSVGAHAARVRGLLALALAIAVFLIQDGVDLEAGYPSVRTDAGFYALLALAWAAGMGVRELRRRAQRLEQMSDELARLAVVEERARLARELHDIVAHTVAVMTVHAGAARQLVDVDPAEAKTTLMSAEEQGRQAMGELRRLLGLLRSADETGERLPTSGLRDLRDLTDRVRQGGLEVDLDVVGEPRELPPGVDLSAFRIVQEALTNTLKHATARRATVTVRYREHDVELEVTDDGAATVASNGSGHGLNGLRERAALYGGTLDAGPRPAGGFRVFAALPLELPGA